MPPPFFQAGGESAKFIHLDAPVPGSRLHLQAETQSSKAGVPVPSGIFYPITKLIFRLLGQHTSERGLAGEMFGAPFF